MLRKTAKSKDKMNGKSLRKSVLLFLLISQSLASKEQELCRKYFLSIQQEEEDAKECCADDSDVCKEARFEVKERWKQYHILCPHKDVDECLSSPCDQNASCNNTIASFICTCNKGFEGDGMNCTDIRSCKELKSKNSGLSNGNYKIGLFWTFCDMSSGGWTLLARFSNRDYKAWISNNFLWYDKVSAYGSPLSPSENSDMISDAFWNVKGNEIKITRTDDSSHTALLQTTSNCLGGTTFRSKITSFGNYRNRAVWASDRCRGSCRVRYGGRYKSTVGFSEHSCSSNIQSSKYIGFWCDWSGGDGAVMMIGGGGSGCRRADHGVGITEENEAKFGSSVGYDFGDDSNAPSSYALNLWVR